MPHIAVSMYPGRDDETKREIAEKMQQFYVEAFGVDKEAVSVSIVESRAKNLATRFNNAIVPRTSTFRLGPSPPPSKLRRRR